MKTLMMLAAITAFVALTSCETECTECPVCELEHAGELSEWGEQVKAELVSLFLDVEDLALCQVWSADSQTRFWSGYGSNGADSREIQIDFMNTELVLVFVQFINGKWTSSMIRIPYEMVITTVLQYATHVEGGMVVRRANNVLIYMSDQFDPTGQMDGVEAVAIPPAYMKVNHEKMVLDKISAPTS